MSQLRQFQATDILRFNSVNLDQFTETFYTSYYGQYLTHWPDLVYLTQHPNGDIGSYMIGKAEGRADQWHGHVSAVTVAPQYRRMGISSYLMDVLEKKCDAIYKTNFVDLYVRPSNFSAVNMYKHLGYIVYRRVVAYYQTEDAYDMRKALSHDPQKRSMVPLSKPTNPTDSDKT